MRTSLGSWADIVVCTQVDSEWNAFVYVCDGDGVVCGTKAEREQVRIPPGACSAAQLCAPRARYIPMCPVLRLAPAGAPAWARALQARVQPHTSPAAPQHVGNVVGAAPRPRSLWDEEL